MRALDLASSGSYRADQLCAPPTGCFNHLRTSSTGAEAEAAVFPTSVRVRQSGVALGSTALMAACQDMSNWARVDETPALASRRQLVRKK